MLAAIEQDTLQGVEYGPLEEAGLISAGIDYYKPTMSQLEHKLEPDAEVTFTFKNRGEQRLMDYVDPEALQQRFDNLQARGWTDGELSQLAHLHHKDGTRVFEEEYLDYLRDNELPPVRVSYNEQTDDVNIEAVGPWALSTYWETVVMSEVNEAYFEGYVQAHDIDLMEVYEEGNRRLDEKIAVLQENPDIKFAEFGTRRHFSLRWQKHVMDRLQRECPDNLLGTSNVALANTFGVQPIGTFAHEMPMVFAGLAEARGHNVRDSHNQFLRDWYDQYDEDLSIALTDTFGSEFFFSDFTADQAEQWKGVRHDSGDPTDFGERLIEFYEENGVDPAEKTIVFSDGLDIDTIVELHKHFKDRINAVFGWGTTLTNDLGLQPLNIVMKATHVKTAEGLKAHTVKISDNPGKHTGPEELVDTYANEIFKTMPRKETHHGDPLYPR